MVHPACSDETFIETFELYGPKETSRILKISERSIHRRRRSLELKIGRPLVPPGSEEQARASHRLTFNIKNGVVIIGSDAHYWPGHVTTAHRALVAFCKKMHPKIVIMNGDILDGATISRHPPIGWEHRPSIKQEIETCQERLDEIKKAAVNAKLVWPLGNHDMRFETKIAQNMPEMAEVAGVHLKDHFPEWHPCWLALINDDVVVKHRFKGGIHATHNNTLWAGKTMITGHLHSMKVTPLTDYNGTRWGVDTGTLADPDGPQFIDYTEDNPKNWRSGFVVLTFRDGRLMWPELVSVVKDGKVEFRTEIIDV